MDVGSGAFVDSLIAARMVRPGSQAIGIDMTPAMLEKARRAADEAGHGNLDFREGFGEALPVPDEWADVVITNRMINLMPDKMTGLREMARVLKPTGRI